MSKLISTFKIGFDDETKAVLSELKDKLDAITGSLGVPSALLGSTKPNGGLLVAMSEAANDAPESELLQLGQWVFEGQDEKWKSAALNSDGRAFRHNLPSSHVYFHKGVWRSNCFDQHEIELIDGAFDTSDFLPIQIDRETVNDVDYLSETTPEMQGMDACDIIIDEVGRNYSSNSNCLGAVVPQITQADMQHIFIKNLSEVLIQRMHSMDRFSTHDYTIGADKLMPWDIVFDRGAKAFGVITNTHADSTVSAVFFPKRDMGLGNNNFHILSLKGMVTQTITEAQLTEFRAALEACYA